MTDDELVDTLDHLAALADTEAYEPTKEELREAAPRHEALIREMQAKRAARDVAGATDLDEPNEEACQRAKEVALRSEPTEEELREAEPLVRQLRERIRGRTRENLIATLTERSREWLVARLVELSTVDPQSVDQVSTEELHARIADLELAARSSEDG